MPQLDFSTYLPQIFWLFVTFLVLYVLMRRLALPRVGAAIETRRRRIDEDLGQAGQMKAEAEAVLAAYEKQLADARAEAQSTLRATLERAAAQAAERQRDFADTLTGQIEAAERQISGAKQQALSDIRAVAIEVGRSLTEKLVGAPADEASLAAAVDRVMTERPA